MELLARVISWVIIAYPILLSCLIALMLFLMIVSIKQKEYEMFPACLAMLLLPLLLLVIFFDAQNWLNYTLGFGIAIGILIAIYAKACKWREGQRKAEFEEFKKRHPESFYIPSYFNIYRADSEGERMSYYLETTSFGHENRHPTCLTNRKNDNKKHSWTSSHYTPPSTEFIKREHSLELRFEDGIEIHFNFPIELDEECGWIVEGYCKDKIAIKIS